MRALLDLRRWFERLLVTGLPPVPVALGAVAAVLALGVVTSRLVADLDRATQALLLLVPVVVAAALGGRLSAYLVSGTAAAVLALLTPPVGSFRVRLAEDVTVLLVFAGVALLIDTVVAGRIDVLGRVERQRAVLLRSVSHDLRTPLAAIRAAASELVDGPHDAGTRAKLLDLVGDEAERLDRLVANLLSLGRIEAGALEPRRQPVALAELADAAAARLSRLFLDRQLVVDVPDDLPVVQADYVQLEQVVTNLLENAARHTPVGTAVQLSARATPGAVAVSVADAGPGIPPSEADRVFDSFRSGAIAGTSGIGLAICKAIVEAHGGTIVLDEAPAGGARFTVTLPRG